nr:hypothetical protein [Tanacetum cinerariifolium]
MDSIIPLEQKNTLAEYMILSGVHNRPPMLDKDLYDSWKSRMKLYMKNKEHGRMKYAELSVVEKIQADCDMKATNIILQGSQCNKFRGDKVKVILVLVIRVMLLVLGETMQVDMQRLLNASTVKTEDLDTYDFDCDDISNEKAVLMANISNYGSDVISEVPHSETYLNDMKNQGVHAMQDFEQPPVVDFTDNEIHSDSNIIPYY